MKTTLRIPATGLGLAAVPSLVLPQDLISAGTTLTGQPGYTACVGASESGK